MIKKLGRGSLIAVLLLSLWSCEQKKTELLWDKSLFQIGSQSSPRAADLNQDGILDIVLGGAKDELGEVEQGVFALNGQNGEILWQQKAEAQMVGSATFYDITGDEIPEVFIGGRKHHLKAINGQSGELIWEYDYTFENDSILKYARFNFYNSTLVPDQNGDGLAELLTVNGGNWDAAPHSEKDRYPGVLLLINLKNGSIIAADTMPDGRESYMSPLCFQTEAGESMILFGTGGETIPGNLYLGKLSDLFNRKLSQAQVIVSEEEHGFIAPPAVVDLTGDGIKDIAAISHAGKVTAVNGASREIIWEFTVDGYESSNALAVGDFNRDQRPDLFAILSKGKWPRYTKALRIALEGKSGNRLYQDSSGCFELSSPVVYDLNRDGYDEIIVSSNVYNCSNPFNEDFPAPKEIANRLLALNLKKGSIQVIDESKGFKNIYSTPWIGDLDQDQYLDIVYCQFFNTPEDFSKFRGMRIRRISTHINTNDSPFWGEYMGPNGKGIYPL